MFDGVSLVYLVTQRDVFHKGLGYLRQIFSKIREANLKEGIFVGPQITQLFEDQDFSTALNSTERRAWKVLQNVCRNYLGNKKEF